MAKHLRNKETGALTKVSKTEAERLHATGAWDYVDKDTYQRAHYQPEDFPATGKPSNYRVEE